MKIKRKTLTLIELIVLVVVLTVSVPLFKPKIAILFNNKGIDYYDTGKIDKAALFFKKSLKIRPDPQVYCNLANAYREKKMLKESIIEYNKALQLDPNHIQAYFGLAYTYEEEGRYEEALSYLEKVESLDLHRARKELEKLRFKYAVSLFSKASDFYTEGDKNNAELKLKEAIALKPNFSFAYKTLGDINFSKNLFAEAIANYKRAMELGLSNVNIYNLHNDIGISYAKLENYSEALKYLRKAYKLEPNNVNILYNLATTLRDNKNFAQALKKYKKLVGLNFSYPNVHNDMGDIYKSLGKQEDAEKEYKNEAEIVKAELSRIPGNIYSLSRLALAYNGLGQHAEAKKIIDSVIEKRPDYGEAFYTRAKIYENLGETKKAISDLKKARNIFPKVGFIDSYIFRLKSKRPTPKDKEAFLNDTIIYLTNGRQIQGKLKMEVDDRIFLDVLVGDSFGTIAINRQDIKSLDKLK